MSLTSNRCTRRRAGTSADDHLAVGRPRPAVDHRPAGRWDLRGGRGRLRPGVGRAQHRQPGPRGAGDNRCLPDLADFHRLGFGPVPDPAHRRGGALRARIRRPARGDQSHHPRASAVHLPAHLRFEPDCGQRPASRLQVRLSVRDHELLGGWAGARRHRPPLHPAGRVGHRPPDGGRARRPAQPIADRARDPGDGRGP